ncbi:MAG: cob(I)yrinic acid a,c-diamide adenosyltransferase [Lentisphaeria bacterium]
MVKIYTKSGDQGSTSLYDGSRVPKSSPIIAILGDLDELNSFLGLAKCKTTIKGFYDSIADIQHQIYLISAQIASPHKSPQPLPIDTLEKQIDQIMVSLPKIYEFTTPGSNELNALFHICRTICRRTERTMQQLQEPHNNALIYINRLSDLLYAFARACQ